jgi:large subunit ribosomal protein L29
MKLADIRELQTVELQGKVLELKQELFTLRFQQATGQLQNGSKMKDIRKTIARILTVIKEREQVK